jgi:hypothetical protein
MVCRQDDTDACLSSRREQPLREAVGELGISSIRLDDGPQILIETVGGRQMALARKAESSLVGRLKMLALQSLRRGQETICLDARFGGTTRCRQQVRDGRQPSQQERTSGPGQTPPVSVLRESLPTGAGI